MIDLFIFCLCSFYLYQKKLLVYDYFVVKIFSKYLNVKNVENVKNSIRRLEKSSI